MLEDVSQLYITLKKKTKKCSNNILHCYADGELLYYCVVN